MYNSFRKQLDCEYTIWYQNVCMTVIHSLESYDIFTVIHMICHDLILVIRYIRYSIVHTVNIVRTMSYKIWYHLYVTVRYVHTQFTIHLMPIVWYVSIVQRVLLFERRPSLITVDFANAGFFCTHFSCGWIRKKSQSQSLSWRVLYVHKVHTQIGVASAEVFRLSRCDVGLDQLSIIWPIVLFQYA